MSKTEFLAELAKHLQVLEESEQQDILAEYAQHIDMKMQGGLSEDEAIRDFGSVQELAADILTAYHVRPDFSPQEKEKGHIIYVKGPDMAKLKEGGKQAAGAVGRQAGRFGAWFGSVCGKIRAAFRRLCAKLTRKAQEDFAQGEGKVSQPHSRPRRWRGLVRACGGGISRFFRWLGRVAVTLARWCWNAFWAVASVFLGLFALAALFTFGLLLVWMVRGYPFVGLTLAALGLSLTLGALTCLTVTLIFQKRRLDSMDAPQEPRPDDAREPWDEEEEDWDVAPAADLWPEERLPAPQIDQEEGPRRDDPSQEGGSSHA